MKYVKAPRCGGPLTTAHLAHSDPGLCTAYKWQRRILAVLDVCVSIRRLRLLVAIRQCSSRWQPVPLSVSVNLL